MKRCVFTVVLAALVVAAGGCSRAPVRAALSAEETSLPTEAQPRLATIKLYIGAKTMTTEMALTEAQERCGMMFRTNMGPDEGMIFVFSPPERVSFWMKNCPLALSAAYIDPEGTIVEIHALQPKDTNSVVAGVNNIAYVLETPQGWFERNGVGPGAVVMTEKGTLEQTFR